MRKSYFIAAILAVGAVAYAFRPETSAPVSTAVPDAPAHLALASVTLPAELSQNGQIGKRAFDAACASCHGGNAAGQDGVAPPLIHKIYEPSHHGDESFQRAAALGVRAHHWRFGDMPPVENVTQGDVTLIIAYIRELQRANGIN